MNKYEAKVKKRHFFMFVILPFLYTFYNNLTSMEQNSNNSKNESSNLLHFRAVSYLFQKFLTTFQKFKDM